MSEYMVWSYFEKRVFDRLRLKMNNYSDVKFEISEYCRIQQYRLLGWRDRDPKQREVEVKKLCTDPIHFCQKYKIPYYEDLNTGKPGGTVSSPDTRSFKITKRVVFTIEKEKVINTLHKMCAVSYLDTFNELIGRSNGWYERLSKTDAPNLIIQEMSKSFVPAMRKFYEDNKNVPDMICNCDGFLVDVQMLSRDEMRNSYVGFYSPNEFDSLENGLPLYYQPEHFLISFNNIGYENLTKEEQYYGMLAALLEKCIEEFKKETYFLDVWVGLIPRNNRIGASIKLAPVIKREKPVKPKLKHW